MQTKTLKAAKAQVREMGLRLGKTLEGEYRVAFRDNGEAAAYYTNDLTDAVQTAGAMAAGRKLGSC